MAVFMACMSNVWEETNRFEALVGPHGSHGVALHQDVAGGQQLQRLQGGPVGPQQPLPPLHEYLLQQAGQHLVCGTQDFSFVEV